MATAWLLEIAVLASSLRMVDIWGEIRLHVGHVAYRIMTVVTWPRSVVRDPWPR